LGELEPEGKKPKEGEDGADENEGMVGCFVERLVLAQEERTKGKRSFKGGNECLCGYTVLEISAFKQLSRTRFNRL
jgi:hypothetical protein